MVSALRCDVGLDTDDRFDARILGLLVELVGTVHIAVVGHRDRGYPEAFRPGEKGPIFAAPSNIEHSVYTCR
nr:hypothetical protein [Actinopolyspora righensis]